MEKLFPKAWQRALIMPLWMVASLAQWLVELWDRRHPQ